MPDLPSTLALESVPTGSNLDSSPVRNNFSAISEAVNALKDALASGTAGQVLTATDTDTVAWASSSLPWLVDIDVFSTAVSQTNFDTNNVQALAIHNAFKASSGAQNDEINWDVILAAGTWTVELTYRKASDAGIVSVQFDSVEKGTIDQYNAATSYNNRSTVAAITVATTGKVRLKLKMATKNASSSSYVGYLQHVQLRRTA